MQHCENQETTPSHVSEGGKPPLKSWSTALMATAPDVKTNIATHVLERQDTPCLGFELRLLHSFLALLKILRHLHSQTLALEPLTVIKTKMRQNQPSLPFTSLRTSIGTSGGFRFNIGTRPLRLKHFPSTMIYS